MRNVLIGFILLCLTTTTGCLFQRQTPVLSSNICFTPEQARQTGLSLRELSDLFVRYRYGQWQHLTEKEQYHIENVEWTLINYCTDFTDSGISFDTGDANTLFSGIGNRVKEASDQVLAIITSGEKKISRITALGDWSMKLGAAIASKSSSQVTALLKSFDVPPDPSKPPVYADPDLAREIGLNFARISDAVLAFHYRNWTGLDAAQKARLLNMEMTLLNYNSNFGGLGIKVNEQETRELFERILEKTTGYVTAMEALGHRDISFLSRVMNLAQTVMDLGAAITEEDVPAIEKIIRQETAAGRDYELGRDFGLKFRHMSFLLLQYRYRNWDVLTKEEKYHLENLEFTLTNFNSDFAVFGIDAATSGNETLLKKIQSGIAAITADLTQDDSAYGPFFVQGQNGLKLGAAILTGDPELMGKYADPVKTPIPRPLNEKTAALSRDIALKMRTVANVMLKKTYDHWDDFTGNERSNLGNIEWTLMNFTSNFSVLEIHLKSNAPDEILSCVSAGLTRDINALNALNTGKKENREDLFALGEKILKKGAVLTTEDIPAIRTMIGSCGP
ncbi:hypothetical protein [Desulfobacter vibrioformis]|uniref:hypothetical protein n=1 Tax=Desulfobacter vibrioformis TaxID=34031 RepID=UPI0005555153|nr:hypothetical protein [Desulfobacter vibrioformis]